MNPFRQITIVGTGLLGGSIGLGLKRQGYSGPIVGVGRRSEVIRQAVGCGCIDRGTTDLAQAVIGSDLVILATPIGMFEKLLIHLKTCLPPGAIITDVGSTKGYVGQLAADHLTADQHRRFVGSHPMAGAEVHGPQHARADLFAGRGCVLTPTDATDSQVLERVQSLWRMLGMRLVRMTPEQHDQLVASVSHLPHAMAVMLIHLTLIDPASDESKHLAQQIAATGLKDTTRLASGDPKVWTDIFLTNRQAVSQTVRAMASQLDRFAHWLDQADESTVHEFLSQGQAAREQWLKLRPDLACCGQEPAAASD